MQLQSAVGSYLSNHMQVLWWNWIAILVLIFCYVICAIAGAANSLSKTYSFVVIWTMLLLLAYAVGGTLIVRNPRYRSGLSIGFLIGASGMMISTLLTTAVVSGGNYAAFGLPGVDPKSSTQAVTAFASLLLIALTFFTTFTVLYRDTLLPAGPMASSDASLPPPPAGAAAIPNWGSSSAYGDAEHGGVSGSAYSDKAYTTESVAAAAPAGGNVL